MNLATMSDFLETNWLIPLVIIIIVLESIYTHTCLVGQLIYYY